MLKPTCPLLAHPCIETRCAWWSSEHAICISVGIFQELTAAPKNMSGQPLKVNPVSKKKTPS